MEQKTEASQACPKNFGHLHDYSLREDGKCAYCQHDEEASQAVEPLQQQLIRDGALRQLRHNDGSPGFVLAYDVDITNKFLAALKAQPAPTEAEVMAFGKPFDPKDETIKRLQGLVDGFIQIEKSRAQIVAMRERLGIAPVVPTEAAQGEDSARLLVAVKAYRDLQRKIRAAGRPPHSDYWHQALYEAEAAIDAALASAETGGVKS